MKVETENLLLVGMNRLPFEISAIKSQEHGTFEVLCKDSPGGLASALEPLRKTHNAVYIGWIGKNNIAGDEQAAIEKYCHENSIIPVFLTEEECQLYYGDFANRELWPIFHDLMHMRSPAPIQNKKQAWEMYKTVNQKFAKAYVDFIIQNDIKQPRIWLHDYHLLTCAQEIVKQLLAEGYARSDINLGFFSHIPTPLPKNFMSLNEIDPNIALTLMSGLISNDYCGFQTHENARRLAESAKQLGFTVEAMPGSQYKISTISHRCIIGTNPISIAPQAWVDNSNNVSFDDYINHYFHRTNVLLNEYQNTSPLKDAQTKKTFLSKIDSIHLDIIQSNSKSELTSSTVFDGKRKLIVSVQRADYTKGMPEQLDAYALLLETYPQLINQVSFIFVAVPSRSGLDEFDQTFKIVLDKIQSMRAKYGDNAIQFSSGFDKFRLARLYRKADIIWVNSLADGMNLVAKEAMICQTSDSPGQLLIGKGAGAAEALYLDGKGAYVIENPKNIQATTHELFKALNTSPAQAKLRVENMQKEIYQHTIDHYAQGFISAQNQAHSLCNTSSPAVSTARRFSITTASSLQPVQSQTSSIANVL